MATASTATAVAAAGGRNTIAAFSRKSLTLKPSPHFLLPKSPLNPISISATSRSRPHRIRALSSPPDPATTPLTPTPETLKSRLSSGSPLYGLFLLSSSPTLAEIAALAGYDYVVVDLEHGPGGIPDALPILRALAAGRVPAILRLPEPSPTWAKKALDLGPQGLMFPMVDTPAQAAAAVSYTRFPPRGIRGSAHTVVRASAYGIDDSYLSRCEDETLIMCQVETAAGLDNIEEIAAVGGVDVIQMGPLDLSASMGYLWDPGNRKVRAALREAERRVFGVKKAYLGGFAMPHDPPEDLKMRGYHMVAGAVDLGMFRKAAVDDVRRFRMADTDIGEEDSDGEKTDDEKYWSE